MNAGNYSYDEEGRLTKDVQEGIDLIEWRVDGKVKKIHRPLNSEKNNVSFDYDAMEEQALLVKTERRQTVVRR